MGFATKFGLENGKIYKLLAPIDGGSKFCGITPGYEEYKYLYLRNLMGNPVSVFKNSVCVKECPVIASNTVECISIESAGTSK